MPLLWLTVILLPLVLTPLLIGVGGVIAPRVGSQEAEWKAGRREAAWQSAGLWLTLAPWPALLAGMLWPDTLILSALWPGAEWGLTGTLNRSLLLFTAALWSLAGLYGGQQLQGDARPGPFVGLWLLALAGNLLLIIAADAISFYVGFTVMSLSAYGLVIYPRTPAARRAGRLYLQLAVLGEMLLYGGLMLRLYETGGSSDFSEWREIAIQPLTAALLLIGFGIKAGFWPLHLWLPQAHPVAPAAASAILSGAMLKAGILGLWQFMPIRSELLAAWSPWLLTVGFIGAFYAALIGLPAAKAKTALAFSSVSQMGYLLAILALAWRFPDERAAWGSLLGLYAVHHGLAKGSLFLGAGLSAAGQLPRWLWWCLWLPALSLAGLPLTAGAAAKVELKSLMGATTWEASITLLSIGSVCTALIALRALVLMQPLPSTSSNTAFKNKSLQSSAFTACLLLPALLLALASVVLPWSWPPLREAHWYSLSLENLISLAWPLGAALIVVWIWQRSVGRVPSLLQRLPSPGPVLSLQLHRLLRGGLRSARRSASAVRLKHWRFWERRWNRLWQQEPVMLTAWLSGVLLCVSWLWL